MTKFKNFLEDYFILFTTVLSAVISLLYFWKGMEEGFSIFLFIVIAGNVLYIPFVFLFKRKSFSYFYLFYSIVLIFVIAFTKTYLYNNYSALFIICLLVMINPKFEIPAFTVYFAFVSVAFALNDENLCHYLIHITRSIWFIGLMIYVLSNKFERKKLILFNDEKEILKQLCDGLHYQKEVEGFSENTIYRKLKAARERNRNITRDELIELYKKELESQKE